jgi:reactive intermediate/imine deaminase
MPRTVLRPQNLEFQPRPSFPYSPGARGGNTIFTAGQVAWDTSGEVIGLGDVRAQTLQTLNNVKSVLAEGGAGLDDVLKCNVYLKDISDFQAMNEVFASFFPTDPPARTTVQALLADPEMLVEIEAIAYLD